VSLDAGIQIPEDGDEPRLNGYHEEDRWNLAP
jgi:hypothetical protein